MRAAGQRKKQDVDVSRILHVDVHWLLCSAAKVTEYVTGLKRCAHDLQLQLVQVCAQTESYKESETGRVRNTSSPCSSKCYFSRRFYAKHGDPPAESQPSPPGLLVFQ